MKMNDEIKDNLYDLYASYRHHKQLFDYWQNHKTLKSEDEIRERIDYIIKNKIAQRDEISTLLWVLGEKENEKENEN